ncbi:hypothetical protein JKI95_03020 [Corynebacterium aquatimens]|uniref:hypothetical protein n=1 Tax=Corynebacterium aquatimens TaxID=1190508 RepID=UPI0025407D5E|nr:hypothetical protein [Corynebacterium aquatimens]QYH20024.1 hypothetical protein JKI95_03020 [Corynebacterium aquatimens]
MPGNEVDKAFRSLCSFWAERFPQDSAPTAFGRYLAWASEVIEAEGSDIDKLVFHEKDYEAFGERGLRKEMQRIRNFMLGGEMNKPNARRVWPNVPQHFKGDPRRARFVSILMNPGRDTHLQRISTDSLNPGSEEIRSLLDTGATFSLENSEHYASLYSGKQLIDWPPPSEKEQLNRLLEQGEILASLTDADLAFKDRWRNWTDQVKLYTQTEPDLPGLTFENLECFAEIELFPYQSVRWPDIPASVKNQFDHFESVKKAQALIIALAEDTLEGAEGDVIRPERSRIFVVRGGAQLDYFLKQTANERLRHSMGRLLDAGLYTRSPVPKPGL